MSRIHVKVETRGNFYVYVRLFIQCFCYIYTLKIYVCTHGKITRQWKSSLTLSGLNSNLLVNLDTIHPIHHTIMTELPLAMLNV